MWEQVGPVRDARELTGALDAIDRIAERLEGAGVPGGPAFNLAWQDWLNLVSRLRYIVTISADHATVASPCGNQRVRCESARKIASGWRRWCKAARRRSGSR